MDNKLVLDIKCNKDIEDQKEKIEHITKYANNLLNNPNFILSLDNRKLLEDNNINNLFVYLNNPVEKNYDGISDDYTEFCNKTILKNDINIIKKHNDFINNNDNSNIIPNKVDNDGNINKYKSKDNFKTPEQIILEKAEDENDIITDESIEDDINNYYSKFENKIKQLQLNINSNSYTKNIELIEE